MLAPPAPLPRLGELCVELMGKPMLMNVVSKRLAVRMLEDKVLGLILSLRLNLSLRIRHCLSPSLTLSLNLIIQGVPENCLRSDVLTITFKPFIC